MKDFFDKAKDALKTDVDQLQLDNFISKYASREERHYCAYLFSWLITSPDAIKIFFCNHSASILESIPELNSPSVADTKIYYEYTALRELIDFIGRKVKQNHEIDIKDELKKRIELEIFLGTKGDIQKKKPDLVFYFPHSKTIVLIEAKFEMGFEMAQLEESRIYGEVLKKFFPDDINKVIVTALGLNYHLGEIEKVYSSISWEKLFELVPEVKIRNEIKNGLDYQKIIHPKAMASWKII